jgi:hypothetical protein
MAGIFINYRRDDAPGVAGRLFDYLALKYPRRNLFMDVDAMKPGRDFAEQLDTQVSQCRVLLAVIGPRWLDAKDQTGHRRLDGEHDYVRIELASALKRDIPVIPVLVDGATMPSEESLAADLKPLVRRHALELRHTRFNADADAIVHALESVVPRRRAPWGLVITAAVVVAAVVALAVSWPKLSAKLHPGAAPATIVATNPPAPNRPAATVPSAPPASPPAASSTPANNATAAPIAPALTVPAPAPAPPSAPPAPAPLIVAALGPAAPAGLPAGVKVGDIMTGIAFRGSIMRVTEIPADPQACQAACRAESHCVVWTYTQPPATGSSARCSLKAVIPEAASDSCCTSAIERIPPPDMRVPPPIPAGVTGALAGVELDGGTYTYFGGANATPDGCQAACRADGQCMAWDYVRPGVFGTDARCFLKNKPSMQVSSPCCIAGFEHQAVINPAAPAAAPVITKPTGTAAMPNTNLFGSDYRNFVMGSDNWSLCESACKADTQCLAWTAVHPGIQGTNARCWLKNKIPPANANACCTSGIERAEGH